MKKCPFCEEEIQDAAVKCKHCKEWLKTSLSESIPAGAQRKLKQQRQRNSYNLLSIENIVFIIAFVALLLSQISTSSSSFPFAYGLGATLTFFIGPIIFAVFYNIFSYSKGSFKSLKIAFIVITLVFVLLHFSQSVIKEAVNASRQNNHSTSEGHVNVSQDNVGSPQKPKTVFDDLFKDQDFLRKSMDEQRQILGQIDPNFAKLHPINQELWIDKNVPAPKR